MGLLPVRKNHSFWLLQLRQCPFSEFFQYGIKLVVCLQVIL